MTKKLLALVTLTVAASALVLLLAGPTESISAQGPERAIAACPNPGLYTGSDANGNFQNALEDAIDAAEACAGCCDMLVSYGVIETTGERGGFVFHNDIDVTIKASW